MVAPAACWGVLDRGMLGIGLWEGREWLRLVGLGKGWTYLSSACDVVGVCAYEAGLLVLVGHCVVIDVFGFYGTWCCVLVLYVAVCRGWEAKK